MARIDTAYLDVGRIDTLSHQDTPIHRLDPRAKVLTTVVFIVTVVSFDKYEVTGLIPFFLYPVILVSLGNLPPGFLLKRMALVAPFAIMVGLFNPFLDKEVLITMGPVGISGGWVSFASIMFRFTLTVGAALTLIASTGFNAVCMAMERLGAPRLLAVQMLMLYRYIFVLVSEGSRMVRARSLRSFNGGAMNMRVFGSLAGHLLLRTLDRANRIHLAMLSRGFDGSIRLMKRLQVRAADVCFVLGWSAFFVLFRMVDVPLYIGKFLTEYLA